jgi:hypothetical protein
MSALILGLLVASARGFFETQNTQVTEMSANVIVLDQLLADYGPETKEASDLLRDSVVRTLDQVGRGNPHERPKWVRPSTGRFSWTQFKLCRRRTTGKDGSRRMR